MSTLTAIPGFKHLQLNSFQLKLIGMILMVFDHVHEFFWIDGVPIWFTWIGRIVAPIFLFASAEGFHYTRSKGKYLLHLYIGFLFMNGVSSVVQQQFPSDNMLLNNIFGTLFLAVFYMWMIDILTSSVKARSWLKGIGAVVGLLIPIALSAVMLSVLNSSTFPAWSSYLWKFVPIPLLVEGSFWFVLLGIAFYLLRRSRALQIAALAAFSLFLLYSSGFDWLGEFQWMMVFAAIPIALYNGQKGPNMKYLFYVFYPAHIYFLYLLAYFLHK